MCRMSKFYIYVEKVILALLDFCKILRYEFINADIPKTDVTTRILCQLCMSNRNVFHLMENLEFKFLRLPLVPNGDFIHTPTFSLREYCEYQLLKSALYLLIQLN